MNIYQKLILPVTASLVLLAGCENLPGSNAQQGAVAGGAAGAVAGNALGGGALETVVGGALGAGAGYVIGKETEDDGRDRRRRNRR